MSERATIHRDGFVHLSATTEVRRHASQAYKLVVGVDADVEFEVDGRSGRAPAVLVPPHVAQAMRLSGIGVAFFAELGSSRAPFAGARATLDLPGGRRLERLRAIAREASCASVDGDAGRLDEAFRALDLGRGPRVDRRAVRALAILAEETEASVESVAARLGLSTDRLRHVVRDACGLPLRRHRLWHRTLDATERVIGGAPIGRAAIDAGFSDHAHYSRSFAAFFGRTPSSLTGPSFVATPYGVRATSRCASSCVGPEPDHGP